MILWLAHLHMCIVLFVLLFPCLEKAVFVSSGEYQVQLINSFMNIKYMVMARIEQRFFVHIKIIWRNNIWICYFDVLVFFFLPKKLAFLRFQWEPVIYDKYIDL